MFTGLISSVMVRGRLFKLLYLAVQVGKDTVMIWASPQSCRDGYPLIFSPSRNEDRSYAQLVLSVEWLNLSHSVRKSFIGSVSNHFYRRWVYKFYFILVQKSFIGLLR
ncbi:expressed unknown protein [Seminavis robusta]|uniref:Uncharacterized protein n=1 Tax=Seminavis robusta TaxID=568900 RepID=A0A9N8H3G9_9STRA|nr:expressed unknown protein [Seminavis robusta]|eukprot:Sro60_g034590.1 n/a (108) ;mRNA; f:38976-40483